MFLLVEQGSFTHGIILLLSVCAFVCFSDMQASGYTTMKQFRETLNAG